MKLNHRQIEYYRSSGTKLNCRKIEYFRSSGTKLNHGKIIHVKFIYFHPLSPRTIYMTYPELANPCMTATSATPTSVFTRASAFAARASCSPAYARTSSPANATGSSATVSEAASFKYAAWYPAPCSSKSSARSASSGSSTTVCCADLRCVALPKRRTSDVNAFGLRKEG